MATSRTSRARSRKAAQWFCDRVRAHRASGTSGRTNGPGPKATGVGFGLLALVLLTTCAVAWVSVWWVPAYLAAMVLIFVTPQGVYWPALVSKPGDVSTDHVVTHVSHDLRVDRVDKAENHHLIAELISGPLTGEVTSEPVDGNPGLASAITAKPRRGRGRSRKVVNAATEQALASPSVTWVRVGPGKFIRADTSVQANVEIQTEDVIAEATPTEDAPAQVPLATWAPAHPLVEEQPPNTPGATHGDEESVVTPVDRAQDSVTEEYGIAPSAFGPLPQVSLSVEGLEDDLSDTTGAPEAVSGLMADLDATASEDGKRWEQPRSPVGIWESRRGRGSRGIASAILNEQRPSSRQYIRNGPKPRTLVWSPARPDTRLQQAACRASGRIYHVQRALRPRSPPHR
jgi:hypothetical protein